MRYIVLASWLSLAACQPHEPLQVAVVARSAIPERLRVVGTEPFWAAQVAGEDLTYSTPEAPDGTGAAVRRSESAAGAVFVGTLDGVALRLRITPGTCSDGMSDVVYPFHAELELGSERRQGCAREDRPGEVPSTT